MYVNVVFVITCLYNAVSLTLVREQHFIINIIVIIIVTECIVYMFRAMTL